MSKARKIKKVVRKEVDVLEDDEFPIEEEQQPQQQPNVSMKQMMEEVVKTEADTKQPILSSFPKALEKKEKKEKKAKKEKKEGEDKALRYINNPTLQKQLKGLTMRGVAKIMNMISQYKKTHPQQQ